MPLRVLEEFDVQKNQLVAVPAHIFAHNQKLRRVNFNSNRIKRLTATLFEGLTELQVVSFSGNQIQSLCSGLFKDSSKLTQVEFQGNQISKIAPDAFHRAAPLEKSWLSGIPCAEMGDITKCTENWGSAETRLEHGESIRANLGHANRHFSRFRHERMHDAPIHFRFFRRRNGTHHPGGISLECGPHLRGKLHLRI